jgi:hypothetical protein
MPNCEQRFPLVVCVLPMPALATLSAPMAHLLNAEAARLNCYRSLYRWMVAVAQ